MNRVLSSLMAASLVAAGIGVWFLHRQNRQLVQKLELARQEITNLESPANPLPAEPAPSGSSGQVEVAESELLRLRGAAARAARAEAEVAELRREVARARAPGATRTASDSTFADTLTTYLGTRVEAPANLDPSYTRDGLLSAIQLAAQKAQISLRKMSVDDSEFPFLLGVTTEAGDWPKLVEQLKQLDGYEFHGSVGNETSHTLCPVPSRAYPPEQTQNITRRMNARLEQFYSTFSAQN